MLSSCLHNFWMPMSVPYMFPTAGVSWWLDIYIYFCCWFAKTMIGVDHVWSCDLCFFLQTTSNNYVCLRLFKAFYGYVYVKCNELWQLCHTHRFIGKCTRKGGVSWWGQHLGCHLILVVGLQLNGQRTLWSYVRKSYVQSNQHQSTPGFFPEFHAHYPRKIFYTRLVGRVVWPNADSTLPGRGDGVGVLTCLALASWSWYYATARRAQCLTPVWSDLQLRILFSIEEIAKILSKLTLKHEEWKQTTLVTVRLKADEHLISYGRSSRHVSPHWITCEQNS